MTHPRYIRNHRRYTLIPAIFGIVAAILFLQTQLLASEGLKKEDNQAADIRSIFDSWPDESKFDRSDNIQFSTNSFNGFTSGAYSYQITGGGVTYKVNFELSQEGNFGYLGPTAADPLLDRRDVENIPIAPIEYISDVMKNYENMSTIFSIEQDLENPVDRPGAVNFQLDFYDQGGELVLSVFNTLAPSTTYTVSLSSIEVVPDGFRGSAVLTSNYPLLIKDLRAEDEIHNLKSAYKSVEVGQNTLVAPTLFKNKDSQTTELCVQNTSESEADYVTVQYSNGIRAVASLNLNGSVCFNQANEGHADGWHGGATISSDVSIAGFVRAVFKDGETPLGRWAYTLSGPEQIGNDVAFPLLLTAGKKSNWNSTIYYYNFGDDEAVISPRYTLGLENLTKSCPDPITIPPNSVGAISMPGDLLIADVAGVFFKTTGSVAFSVINRNLDSEELISDRTFAYGAGYPSSGDSIPDPENCDEKIPQYVYIPIAIAP